MRVLFQLIIETNLKLMSDKQQLMRCLVEELLVGLNSSCLCVIVTLC